jgi:NAD(P)-dependent dehydrogenase (short-subunit alcohol dehydrogenase family)
MLKIAKENATSELSVEEYLNSVRAANPTGRMALPSDVAAAVVFLISDEAGFINGTSMVVDGGQIA